MTDNVLQDLLRQRGAPGRFDTGDALPTRKAEQWKYTDLKRLEKIGWTVWLAEDEHGVVRPPETGLELDGAVDLVLVNGFLDRDLSALDNLPTGLSVEAGPAADAWGEGFTERLSDALAQEELTIRVDPGRTIEAPIHIRHVTWGADKDAAIAHAARVTITVGAGAEACIVESHVTAEGRGFSVPSLGVSLDRDARLGLYTLLGEGAQSAQLALSDIGVAENAVLDSFILSVGDGLSRRETRLSMAGERGEAALSGSYFGAGDAVIDNTTFVTHGAENATSRQFFRGVLDDHARGVFQGKVLVREGAQGTDGQQQHKALLLSRHAEVDAKPELEIYADDVQCAHGATVGAIDADQLFYMRARGIPEDRARAMLTESFLIEAVEKIARPAIRDTFRNVLSARLNGETA
ncbi:MAG: Fe-S cluster assembly protein SufD [Pseudomonadota bacterium]|nr:Fe-S cluster assembly protein SufD [Pseudomonadota bacterium]